MQIFDTASGESVFEGVPSELALQHQKKGGNSNNDSSTSANPSTGAGAAAVWSVCVRPDGKGFMSGGADQRVTFWDFIVSAHHI